MPFDTATPSAAGRASSKLALGALAGERRKLIWRPEVIVQLAMSTMVRPAHQKDQDSFGLALVSRVPSAYDMPALQMGVCTQRLCPAAASIKGGHKEG